MENIKKAIKKMRQRTEKFIHREETIELPWGVYDSDYENINDYFEPLIGVGIKEYLSQYYGEKIKRGELIGVEFGGPGSSFFFGFGVDFFKRTAGFTLKDKRSTSQEAVDDFMNHDVIESDVFLNNRFERSWRDVELWVEENGKPDFIIERMVAGNSSLIDLELTILIFKRWYEVLNDGGTIMLEIPTHINNQQLAHLITLLVDRKKEFYAKVGFKTFVLRKMEEAPKKL